MTERDVSPDTPETYDASRFERPSVTVDLVVFTLRQEQLQALLVQRKHWPFEGMWALPGGFVNMDEGLEKAARRELEEETGVRDVYLEQLYTFGQPDRDPRTRVITVAYFALISSDQLELVAASDAADAGWFPVSNLPPLAFDHADIVSYAVTRLRYKLEYSAVGFQLLPAEFTLTELQNVYETILDEKLDKRNFRRRIFQANILEETGFYRVGEHRPAKIYRFRDDAVAEIKARRLFP